MPTPVTITVGNSGHDHTTLQSATASSDVVDRGAGSEDEIITIECYNTNNVAIPSTTALINSGTLANNVTIIPADGEDYASSYPKALRYDPADGVAFEGGGSFASTLRLIGNGYTRVISCQLDAPSSMHVGTTVWSSDTEALFTDCIIHNSSNGLRTDTSDYTNCLFIRDANLGVRIQDTAFNFLNQCTWVCPEDLTSTTVAMNLHGTRLINCAVFGFDSAPSGSGHADSEFNATDESSIAGSDSIPDLIYADQFVDVDDSTQDWNMKVGNDLDGAGTGGIDIGYRLPDALGDGGGGGETNPVDIVIDGLIYSDTGEKDIVLSGLIYSESGGGEVEEPEEPVGNIRNLINGGLINSGLINNGLVR